MKKISILIVGFALVFAGSFTFAQSFDTVLNWMHGEGLTKYNSSAEFRPADNITRGETAKFVSQYAKIQGLKKYYSQCDFSDIDGYDYTLVPHIIEACQYGLLKGSNGVFNPNNTITEAQAITVIIRSLSGFLDETGPRRRSAYYEQGKALGIIKGETLDGVNTTNITRQKLGTRFYIAANQITATDLQELDGAQELFELLTEMLGSEVPTLMEGL